MNITQVKIGAMLTALGIALATTHAFANVPDSTGADADTGVRQLIAQPALVWPHNVSQEREAKVMLRYTIEPDGHVDQVTVVGPAAEPFAEAAKNAISSRIYTPAATPTIAETVARFHAAP
jgi:hypothetical protein